MEKAYVGMMGGYTVLKDGDEKHKATHIVLTICKCQHLFVQKMEYFNVQSIPLFLSRLSFQQGPLILKTV